MKMIGMKKCGVKIMNNVKVKDNFYTEEKVINKIVRMLSLDDQEQEMLIHDIHNLRGCEWLEQVESLKNQTLLQQFKEIACIEDDM